MTILRKKNNNKINFNGKNFKQKSPLQNLVDNIQKVAFDQTPVVITQYFSKNGAGVDQFDLFRGKPPMSAVNKSRLQVISCLVQNKVSPKVVEGYNNSPLKIAFQNKNLASVEELIKHGADVNRKDKQNRTVLHHAFYGVDNSANASCNLEAMLLKVKVNINALYIRKRTPLFQAFVKIGDPFNQSFIDPIECVASALTNNEFALNVKNEYCRTMRYYASQHDMFTSIMILLKSGADIYQQDNDGITPPGLASSYEHSQHASMGPCRI